jgi:glycopeptide antibiotics resistance protein
LPPPPFTGPHQRLVSTLSGSKARKGNMSSKHTFVALNLMFYCTFSVSMVVFQLFLKKKYEKMGA